MKTKRYIGTFSSNFSILGLDEYFALLMIPSRDDQPKEKNKISPHLLHDVNLNCTNKNEGGKKHNQVLGLVQRPLNKQKPISPWWHKHCCPASEVSAQERQTVLLVPPSISVLPVLCKRQCPTLLAQLPGLLAMLRSPHPR